jgi:hypothetical protein
VRYPWKEFSVFEKLNEWRRIQKYMYEPTRRDFLTYAVGAMLTSALPLSAQTCGKDPSSLPLSVDLVGPMAFRIDTSKRVVDIWLPNLSNKHEAGIITSADVTPLNKPADRLGDYNISFGSPSSPPPPPNIFLTNKCTVHSEHANFPVNKYIHLTLPMPNNIAAVSGMLASIYSDPSTPDCKLKLYAVGLRFLYEKAGIPKLTPFGGSAQDIPLCVAPFENQVIMSINYTPVQEPDDPDDQNTRTSFRELAEHIGLKRTVEFRCKKGQSIERSANRPCKAPIILVT